MKHCNAALRSQEIKVLVLGAKEFPFRADTEAQSEDEFPSGGIEAYTDSLCRELAKTRVLRVTLATRRFSGQPREEEFAGGRLRILRVPWVRGFLLRSPSFNIAALRAARSLDFDVVHAHGPIAALLAPRLGKPVVATPHGVASGQPQYNAFLRAALRRVEKQAYSRADAVVFLSEAERSAFREKLCFLPRRNAVIPTGIDVARYSRRANAAAGKRLRASLGLRQRTFVIAFVGRLVAVKGLRYLIDAVAMLEKQKPEIAPKTALIIAGDGPERAELEALARERGIEKSVFFLGERRDIPGILAASNCFVLPSLSEGMPLALLEALAASAPCIVTRIGLPVRANREALVVSPRSALALALAIKKLEENPVLRARLAAAGLALAKRFTWSSAAQAHAELYRSLITAR